MKRILFISLLLLAGIVSAQTDSDIEKMPSFPGGDQAFFRYLQAQVELPVGFDKVSYLEKNNNKYVTIAVGFTVDVDGSIINVKVLDGEDEALDEKAVEIVKNMPKWVPAISKEGIEVKVDYAIPIRFDLS